MMNSANKVCWWSVVEAVLVLGALASSIRDWLTDSANGLTVLLWLAIFFGHVWRQRHEIKARWAARKRLEATGARFIVYVHPPGARTVVRDRVPRSRISPMRMMLGDQEVCEIFFEHQVTDGELAEASLFPEATIYGPLDDNSARPVVPRA